MIHIGVRRPVPMLLDVGLVLTLALGGALILAHVSQGPTTGLTPRAPDWRMDGERAVESAQTRLARFPDDPRARARLASAYLLRVRETADPSYYTRADALLRQAAAEIPDEVEVLVAQASLALSRHEFADALVFGERAIVKAPASPAAYGAVVDALIELGRYAEAAEAAQQLVDLRPDAPAYARVSYLRELHGDLHGAVEAMRRAVQSSSPLSHAAAWSQVQLGHLLFTIGDLGGAAREYDEAMQRVDSYAYALAGLARVQAARGRLDAAIALYERAAAQLPLPEFVGALGDAYAASGDVGRAETQYELVEAMLRLLEDNGVQTDLDLALFNADHDRNLEWALVAARSEFELRPSVQAADVLAWAEYKNGDLAAAQIHSAKALRLGSRDPAMLYRAGVIAQESGDLAAASAMLRASADLNPRFSVLWADDLAARLDAISAAGGRW